MFRLSVAILRGCSCDRLDTLGVPKQLVRIVLRLDLLKASEVAFEILALSIIAESRATDISACSFHRDKVTHST